MACYAAQVFAPFSKRQRSPLEKSLASLVKSFVDLLLTVWFKCFQYLSGGWIDCLNTHSVPPFENKKQLKSYYILYEGIAVEYLAKQWVGCHIQQATCVL